MKILLILLLLSVGFSVTTDEVFLSKDVLITENQKVSVDQLISINVEVAVNLVSENEEQREEKILITADIKTDIAIMIDFYTGDVLFEKNADKYWSAASLSKLFLIHQIMEKVEKGELDLDEYVEIDNEDWLLDMPSDAALMFLEKGQRVTYRQLLQGLSVISGNDAAYFVVHHLFGGKDNYAKEVNEFFSKQGFDQMHLEEPSGLSGFNRINARQFAGFCRYYIDKYSPLLKEIHSLESFQYPKEDNLEEGMKYKYQSVSRKNTNLLLGKYEGVDGLKTGYISISGFNLVATAEREGERLIVVLLGGKGKSISEGRRIVAEDASSLLDKGFEAIFLSR